MIFQIFYFSNVSYGLNNEWHEKYKIHKTFFLGGGLRRMDIYNIYIYIYIYLYTMCFLGWSVFQSEKDGPGS